MVATTANSGSYYYTPQWTPQLTDNAITTGTIDGSRISSTGSSPYYWYDGQVTQAAAVTASAITISGDTMSKVYKTLYEVFVVDNDGEIISGPDYVVAKDAESAKFKTDVYGILKEYELDLEDVTIIVNSKGQVKIEKEGCCC